MIDRATRLQPEVHRLGEQYRQPVSGSTEADAGIPDSPWRRSVRIYNPRFGLSGSGARTLVVAQTARESGDPREPAGNRHGDRRGGLTAARTRSEQTTAPPRVSDSALRSVRPIHARSVVDTKDDHRALFFIDLMDHSVHTAARRVQSGELASEATADSVRVADERGEHELDDRCRSALGEPMELALSGAGDPQLVPVILRCHFSANRARSSSPVM